MNVEFGTFEYSSSLKGDVPPLFLAGVEASSKGRNRQEKRARARRFHEQFQKTPSPAQQPDQPIKRTSPQHYLHRGGPVKPSQRRWARPS